MHAGFLVNLVAALKDFSYKSVCIWVLLQIFLLFKSFSYILVYLGYIKFIVCNQWYDIYWPHILLNPLFWLIQSWNLLNYFFLIYNANIWNGNVLFYLKISHSWLLNAFLMLNIFIISKQMIHRSLPYFMSLCINTSYLKASKSWIINIVVSFSSSYKAQQTACNRKN